MLKITNIPQGEKISNEFEIKLNGKCVEAFSARVSRIPFNCIWPGHQRPLDQTEEAPFITYASDEKVVVKLKANKKFDEAIVRPLSKNIVPEVNGQTIKFTIEECGQYSVELDGQNRALHIFANPNVDFGVSENDENVLYFGAGVHKPGIIELKDNQTVYIDQDAVVYTTIVGVFVKNVKILGYGIIDGSLSIRSDKYDLIPFDHTRRRVAKESFEKTLRKYYKEDNGDNFTGTSICENKESFTAFLQESNMYFGCIHLYCCENTIINGVVLRDSACFTIIEANCTNAICDNVKLIGMWRYNSDGIDLFNSRNCVIKNSFLRNFDDCVVIKGIVGWDKWPNENILIENCVIWCDWGRNLEIGAETNAPEYRNIVFKNCDCIHCTCVALDVQHCDRAYIHDITFENIRVEYSKHDVAMVYQESDDMDFKTRHNQATAICVEICESGYSDSNIKGRVENVRFKNIKVLSDENMIPSIVITGLDNEHTVKDVTIENLTFNGKKLEDASIIFANEFTNDIKLK